ncbi:MAG: IucA/IucC family protein [Legionella sp.]|nr:IucA/IucC family protein [Legionella sp.]
MALAFGSFNELSHQLRFLLFEIGIGYSQHQIDHFITRAHQDALHRLQRAALDDELIPSPIISHNIHDYINQLNLFKKNPASESILCQWKTIHRDVNESIANEALALAYKERWNAQIIKQASSYGALWTWLNKSIDAHECVTFLEQWGNKGDPYNPAFRAKIGFTRREVLQYCPEFQGRMHLHWAALAKTKALIASQSNDMDAIMANEFPDEYRKWQEKLMLNRLNPDKYYPIPIHPWQWRHQLQNLCKDLIDDRFLILFPHHQTVFPSMAFKTHIPASNQKIHLKLASCVNAIDIPPRATDMEHYGPVISNWLCMLLKQECRNHLFLAKDWARLAMKDSSLNTNQQNELSVTIRQNPLEFITPSQKLIPLASLFNISPLTHTSLLGEIIKNSFLSPIEYFQEYCHLLLYGQLTLLIKFGVVVTSPLTELLIILDDGKPHGIVIRSVDHLVIGRVPHLKYSPPDLPDDALFITSDLNALPILFVQNTIHYNLECWIEWFLKEFQIQPHILWNKLIHVMEHVFNELTDNCEQPNLKREERVIISLIKQHKKLMSQQSNPFINHNTCDDPAKLRVF